MIDIVFDSKEGDVFCGESYPCVDLSAKASCWKNYEKLAQNFIAEYSTFKAVIVRSVEQGFSVNKFSVALFVESIQASSNIDYVVFKVSDLNKAIDCYKPYLALTIAIKYVLQLFDKKPSEVYRNISGLGYLGLDIKTNYLTNIMTLKYLPFLDVQNKFKTFNVFDALVMTAILKAVSLAKIQEGFAVEICLNEEPQIIEARHLVEQIIQKISPWIN